MFVEEAQITVERLRNLIGLRVRYGQAVCQIIEVLEDGPCLVIQDISEGTTIQPDQYGEAHRRVPSTTTIRIYNQDGTDLDQDFLSLDLVEPHNIINNA